MTGTCPPFTASGLDPSVLASLPWPLRRPVAQASTLKGAYDLIERYAGEPEQTREMATERANADYIQRFSLWLSGGTNGGVTPNIAPPQGHGTESSQIDAALHAEIFGEPSSS